MPTASDELRSKMDAYFKNGGIEDWQPRCFLMDCGWKEAAGMFTKPKGREPSEMELDCLQFLIEEWDYGAQG